ncbi:hypothetical protein CGRA01v4_13951 [Colletotrichum graminicola]|uniref:Uncharacterized protein n=1 Tax=Colletotrichum graminicola (strain M1.001 / M2 / FGSC 10212) TaxID=645133 RepID=E3QUP1_COLGM|nr:uncharacterized protein GLRG_09723 [Colletotrichum graminicola M1.001]EFQ34579.1 hypothetical protein GLRG_09723 [Colletotrichum graminicola M1.001]WDK22661.1 hypothetical protein CGRA01v4_13951 [Colletotrichum graminicola]
MSRLSPFPTFRAESRASVAASDTTYHTCAYQSFNDVELFAPSSPPSRTPVPAPASPPSSSHQDPYSRPDHYPHHKDVEPETAEMRRQDSGYESLPPRSSFSNPRRSSTASSSHSSSNPRSRGRPTIRRAPKTSPYPTAARTSGGSLYHPQQRQHLHSALSQPPVTFFHFPAHPTDVELAARRPREDVELEQRVLLPAGASSSASAAAAAAASASGEEGSADVAPLPPQATHYWTSDRTRRLEYAAIDAASRGVKGWVKRHLVPDCFVPKEKHVAFDDDTGSVRRYRLELDEEAPCEKRGCGGRRRSWFAWKRSKTA